MAWSGSRKAEAREKFVTLFNPSIKTTVRRPSSSLAAQCWTVNWCSCAFTVDGGWKDEATWEHPARLEEMYASWLREEG